MIAGVMVGMVLCGAMFGVLYLRTGGWLEQDFNLGYRLGREHGREEGKLLDAITKGALHAAFAKGIEAGRQSEIDAADEWKHG